MTYDKTRTKTYGNPKEGREEEGKVEWWLGVWGEGSVEVYELSALYQLPDILICRPHPAGYVNSQRSSWSVGQSGHCISFLSVPRLCTRWPVSIWPVAIATE